MTFFLGYGIILTKEMKILIKLFTHTDLDGVGCAILAKLAFGDNVSITYCNSPNALEDELLTNDLSSYDYVFITDLSFPQPFMLHGNLLTPKFMLFDHHKTAEWLNEYDFANVHVEHKNKLTCGTELFYNYLVKHDLISTKPYFVEQIRLYDTWDWYKSNNNTPKYLNDLLPNPTAENLCQYLFDKISALLGQKNLTLKTLEVWENDDAAAIIRK